MSMSSLLVANRGEIAVRVLRAAAEAGLRGVAVFSEDDTDALHIRRADVAYPLAGRGPRAYLDAGQIVGIATEHGCDALHPGYGFLAEDAAFARRCAEAGITFVGPAVETLALFGDKVRSRDLARRLGVPIIAGTDHPTALDEAREFLAALGPGAVVMVKAVAGGGGRGIRMVTTPQALGEAWERCRSEATSAFGCGDLYVEQAWARARHVEVQIVGDGTGKVIHLGERECSLQRRHQKLVEIAPSPTLSPGLRTQLCAAAVVLGGTSRYRGVGTVEFLVDATGTQFAFLEVNPRLQVEHPVTEAVTGVDLVRTQLMLAGGATLAEIGLAPAAVPAPRGWAIEVRVNTESLATDGTVRPAAGTLTAFDPPGGPGIRVDTCGYTGHRVATGFDSLLAKVVAHVPSGSFADACAKAARALDEFRIEGVATPLPVLRRLLRHPDVLTNQVHTRFVEEHLGEWLAADDGPAPLDFPEVPSLSGAVAAPAPILGTVVAIHVVLGDVVAVGTPLYLLEAMKMEHVVTAAVAGHVCAIDGVVGDTVAEGHPLVLLVPATPTGDAEVRLEPVDLERVRPDLAEAIARHKVGLDAARPEAVARRRQTGQRTARENIADLCDPESFIEYGALAIAAQRRRRALDDLIRRTPGDGMVCGIGRVNGALFGPERSRCVVMSYDYTVLAGTQGLQNHRKKDRLFALAREQRLPLIMFTEGGGGRPGDTDGSGVAGLDCMAFRLFGELSGLVPLVGVNSGYCFAGNAALLGCCDVVIATANSSIGMGGPAMIEGGGLGVFRPDEVGPLREQVRNGVVDIEVADEAEAVAVARRYLGYFQGRTSDWTCADQRGLRAVIPENRLRAYDVRAAIATLADTGSVLELRRGFGAGMVTALVRVEGRPLGIVANNPLHLAGAIDPDGADKAARFLQLCDAHDLPIVFLCDTPGIMVGPEVERRAMVRHAARLFVVGASLTVPCCTIVLRKGYGLGAQAMAGGSFHAPLFTVAWPTGEFGGMGLEGAVKLGFRAELAKVTDPAERRALFEQMVARMYEIGKAVNMASHFEIDDVIDPADSRRWISTALEAAPSPAPRAGKKRPCVDAW